MTTSEQIEDLRHQLSLGDKVGRVTTAKHPTSGEVYAVVMSPEDDAILWAAGPLSEDDDAQGFIDNQFSGDMVDDADWLQGELEARNAWSAIA
jgi:hypothetical protein